nr:hypothetical protein [uncultured Acidocella sp.]
MTREEKEVFTESVRTRLEALVRYCQRHNRPWPPRMNVAEYFKMSSSAVDYHMDLLIKSGRVVRVKAGEFRVPDLDAIQEVP